MKEENKKIDKLSWEEIINSVGKPVYDKKKEQWRIIDGYRRLGNEFGVSFTDVPAISFINSFENYDCLELYLEEMK